MEDKKYKERKKEENRRNQRKEDRRTEREKEMKKNCCFSLLLFYPISYHLIIHNLKNLHGITLPIQCEGL